ncbi:MAG: rRNA maturation RNase YbeY [Actinomycetota bacterium]|nr:rRNA maturation RNase YbeY [Actinomycetota bacterium]
MRIEVRNEAGLGERAVEELRRACRRALRAEGARRDAVLSIALLAEEEMAALNRRYTGREGATDVLAFPMREESGEGFILGDIAICPAAVDAWREEYGVESGEALAFVAVHGVLHLLGYEDGDEEGAGRMDRRQREILRLAGGAG